MFLITTFSAHLLYSFIVITNDRWPRIRYNDDNNNYSRASVSHITVPIKHGRIYSPALQRHRVMSRSQTQTPPFSAALDVLHPPRAGDAIHPALRKREGSGFETRGNAGPSLI